MDVDSHGKSDCIQEAGVTVPKSLLFLPEYYLEENLNYSCHRLLKHNPSRPTKLPVIDYYIEEWL